MKKGISLIVLVITIIVMIILAAAVVISLNNTSVIDKANHAVQATNIKQVEQLATLAWVDAYAAGERDVTKLQEAVDAAMTASKVDTNIFQATASATGVTVIDKTIVEEEEDTELAAPTTAISSNILTISDSTGKATRYIVYVNGVEKTTTTATTVALDTLGLTTGTYSITVKASSSGYSDSAASTAVNYSVISFVIGTSTYYARTGSTWTEWVNSAYNTAEATTSGTTIYIGSAYVTSSGSTAVSATTEISSGTTYGLYTTSSGGSAVHGGGSND